MHSMACFALIGPKFHPKAYPSKAIVCGLISCFVCVLCLSVNFLPKFNCLHAGIPVGHINVILPEAIASSVYRIWLCSLTKDHHWPSLDPGVEPS